MVTCQHWWCGVLVYLFVQFLISSDRLIIIDIGRLFIITLWSLVDLPTVPLVHYRKKEVIKLISNLETEFNFILHWTSSVATEAPEASPHWGRNIVIAGDPRRVTGSKRKSFMADMYGFETDGELAGVSSYLRSRGGFEIEQVFS